MPLVVATRNQGKRREFEVLLDGVVDDVTDLGALPHDLAEVVEDADTFVGNAFKKAWETSIATGCSVLADDSGLEVDALGGAPGVYSARYAGDGGDEANNRKLVRALDGVPAEQRTARYVAVICLVVVADDNVGRAVLSAAASRGVVVAAEPRAPRHEGEWLRVGDRLVVWFRATCEGRIVDEPRGSGGFGYDPHFLVDDWGETMAEVSLAKKNERSHRAAAVCKLRDALASR